MSRRSGVAAEEDDHSDISPFGVNDLRCQHRERAGGDVDLPDVILAAVGHIELVTCAGQLKGLEQGNEQHARE
jgi:hypothetical protein